jgi:Flp pilus assembly protein TadG
MIARRNRRGSEAIELGLIMPIFALLLMAMMDVSWLFFHQSALDASANIGCRAGALIDPGENDENLAYLEFVAQEALINALIDNGTGSCDGTCSTSVSTFGSTPGRSLLCQIDRDVEPLLGVVISPMTIDSTQVVRLEWQY